MENFDFTQFISFDSDMTYSEAKDTVDKYFAQEGFSIIEFDNMDEVKKDYYSDYWKKYSFELQNDDFFPDFMEWKNVNKVPESIAKVVRKIEKLSGVCNKEFVYIICYFAERMKTSNEVVQISSTNLYDEVFKMSIHSFKCPENLIIIIK